MQNLSKQKVHGGTIHGHSSGNGATRTYRIWRGLKQRALNPKDPRFFQYGGEGKTVCDRWLNFVNFLEDMGVCPPELSIDRKDNTKGYYPENCKWSTRKEQQNNMRNNVLLTFNSETLTLSQWAEKLGMARHTLNERFRLGWSVEDALTKPVDSGPRSYCITRGHEMTPDNVYIRKDNGKRWCKECRRIRDRARLVKKEKPSDK